MNSMTQHLLIIFYSEIYLVVLLFIHLRDPIIEGVMRRCTDMYTYILQVPLSTRTSAMRLWPQINTVSRNISRAMVAQCRGHTCPACSASLTSVQSRCTREPYTQSTLLWVRGQRPCEVGPQPNLTPYVYGCYILLLRPALT